MFSVFYMRENVIQIFYLALGISIVASLHVDQLNVSALSSTTKRGFTMRVRTTLIYCYWDKCLEDCLIISPFRKIIPVGSLIMLQLFQGIGVWPSLKN